MKDFTHVSTRLENADEYIDTLLRVSDIDCVMGSNIYTVKGERYYCYEEFDEICEKIEAATK